MVLLLSLAPRINVLRQERRMALASASLATQPLPGVDLKGLWAVPCQQFLCLGEDDGKSPQGRAGEALS